jgi:hypothetical protein
MLPTPTVATPEGRTLWQCPYGAPLPPPGASGAENRASLLMEDLLDGRA